MTRQISRAETWEHVHEAFNHVNFSSFDYETIKESLLDYIKVYYPEDFNDYIESSELIMILEMFAYIGELLSYRIDMNTQENFITMAQRKESILRAVKLISYKLTRNIPARGLLKISSIQTTERVVDSRGRNIANTRIMWNDINNANWKEHFLLITNRIFQQPFGSVSPLERVQVDDVLFELYTLNNTPTSSFGPSVAKFSAVVNGSTYPFEIVPIDLTETGPEERRPERNANLSILYGSDGLGDSSDTTGFFFFTKQGTLNVREEIFDGITPNQSMTLAIDNINETDIWVNNVSSTDRSIVVSDVKQQVLSHMTFGDTRFGEWVSVDTAHAQNIIFNTNKNRHKYEVEALDRDQVRILFGDGEFAEIPSGNFDIWYRVSANEDLVVPKSSITDQPITLSYVDVNGSTQTITFTISLINTLQNASMSETIEHIRRVAPSMYYTQDRMVNGRDYNTYLLQDPSILKLRSVNRTFAGDSKYIAWHDPKEYYEGTSLFGDDLSIYWKESLLTPTVMEEVKGSSLSVIGTLTANQILVNYIEPLLSSTDLFLIIGTDINLLESLGFTPAATTVRTRFNDSNIPYSFNTLLYERLAIINALNDTMENGNSFELYYSILKDEWTVGEHPCDTGDITCTTPGVQADSFVVIRVSATQLAGLNFEWIVRWSTKHLVCNSTNMKFWNTNSMNKVISIDTLSSSMDNITILKANPNMLGTSIIGNNIQLNVLGHELDGDGLEDVHALSMIPQDTNNDGIPDDLSISSLMYNTYSWANGTGDFNAALDVDNKFIITLPQGVNVVNAALAHLDKEIIVYVDGIRLTFTDGELVAVTQGEAPLYITAIQVVGITSATTIELVYNNMTYFQRLDIESEWLPIEATDNNIRLWVTNSVDTVNNLYTRSVGRYPLNFNWKHKTPRNNLIDPAPSNINDIFIITRGFYNSTKQYLENRTSIVPIEPSPRELRNAYANLLNSKMISDEVILHAGKFKYLFGSRAPVQLQGTFKVIRPLNTTLTDNEVKVRIVNVIKYFFDINNWEFGETFYFTELAAMIHVEMGPEIDSIVLVPTYSQNLFGDLFQIQSREDEIFMPDINTSNIQIVQNFTSSNLKQI